MARKNGLTANKISFVLDSGERVYPFKPPSSRAWRKIVKKARDDHPVDFPVRVTRSAVAPDKTSCDSGALEYWLENGKVVSARIWVHSLQGRAAAIDSLLHEWAHLLWVVEVLQEGVEFDFDGEGELPHDDRFWLIFGRLYRSWLNETL